MPPDGPIRPAHVVRQAHVFSIPPGLAFVPTLVDALFAGRFGPPPDLTDPLGLAGTTILLPTRRAARALREEILRRGIGAAILPRIRPIGDVDEDAHLLEPPPEDPADALVLPPAIPRLDRLLTLTRLVLAWGRAVRAQRQAIGAGQALLIPASAADATRLAADLARLIDDMAIAGIGWEKLDRLVPDEYPGYWQATLDFLRIAAEHWPAYLSDNGLADPATRRDTLLRAEAKRLATRPPAGPVIAAGSTGSVPATAALLAAIARLPNGAVVLPGLDRTLDDAAWEAIADPADENGGAPSHPQAGLRRLLAAIGILRADVADLGTPPPAPLAARARLLSEAMRPADTTAAWADRPPPDPETFAGVDLLVARNEQEEALAIAVALRESVETPGRVAALVTPDRNLARRVSVELGRWNIRIDDSSGKPLDTTLPGVFARLFAEAAISPDPVKLLALTKHPLAAFGMSRPRCRMAARALEIALFRGVVVPGSNATLPGRLAEIRLRTEMKSERMMPRARRRLTKADWDAAEKLARKLAAALAPLEALAGSGEIDAAAATRLLAAGIEAAADDGEGPGPLWAEIAGEALARMLEGLVATAHLTMAAPEYPAFLAAAMASALVAPPVGADPRIHIWGTLEARLQSVDLLILGGLDEGVWPGETRTDPWLSRRMRAELGLPPPERRVGLSAHDAMAAMAAPRVIVTRAQKRGGAPTVASRWLQRLGALLGDAGMAAMTARGDRFADLARALDQVRPEEIKPVERPAPRPPLAVRPRELSVTSIETLIRDPYAVYARRILQLEPLDPVGQRADPRLRGTLIHEAMAAFTKRPRPAWDDAARAELVGIWNDLFKEISAYPEVHVVWNLRAPRLADWFVGWEGEREPSVAARHVEVPGKHLMTTPAGAFTLTGRADRIDVLHDGAIAIFDYKTGAPPSARQVLLFTPQMALEVAMAAAGSFGDDFAGRSTAELAWIGLGRIGKDDPLRPAVDDGFTADGLGREAMMRLWELIAAFDDPARPYLSQVRPMFERRFPGDYDHLARVAEWRLFGAAPAVTP